jgi:hypothetical protein
MKAKQKDTMWMANGDAGEHVEGTWKKMRAILATQSTLICEKRCMQKSGLEASLSRRSQASIFPTSKPSHAGDEII